MTTAVTKIIATCCFIFAINTIFSSSEPPTRPDVLFLPVVFKSCGIIVAVIVNVYGHAFCCNLTSSFCVIFDLASTDVGKVEHPVTEMIVGQDLVEWQIRVANGEPLPLTQEQVPLNGHSFEARIYAENVMRGFLPATGTLNHYRPVPVTPTVRVETGAEEGDTTSMHYDPMIAKLVVWGETRNAALVKLKSCLLNFQQCYNFD
ncbi:methylcrotonoyl-CoA carboxylase subunit alpha, mitochondrial-like [Ananas comosus]|uniref:Methylcrotonoyl-CoA carboxylase subunit alpha, mitochondrial-like n=1 Tax=Ananas comosus TaxID=4615 RepID=A0A6P5EGL6_ANACO|nr:methylcrotonoyl-CoA carboxylase subunit alpha, mitochondrial-like [Ananas comosus]